MTQLKDGTFFMFTSMCSFSLATTLEVDQLNKNVPSEPYCEGRHRKHLAVCKSMLVCINRKERAMALHECTHLGMRIGTQTHCTNNSI